MGKKSKKEEKKELADEKSIDLRKSSPQKPKARKPRSSRARIPATNGPASTVQEPSEDEIRIRAYFIAERRMQLSLEGDSTHDWIEARRQLIEESRRNGSIRSKEPL